MCLSTIIDDPSRLIEQGTIEEFEYVITHNYLGHRCGYLKVTPGHPWHSRHDDQVAASVHGGLTFAEADVPCDREGDDAGWWVGFDCGHCFDAPDPTLPTIEPIFSFDFPGLDSLKERAFRQRQIRTTEYVRDQLTGLAAQATIARTN